MTVSRRTQVCLGFSFYCSPTTLSPPPCKHSAVRSQVKAPSLLGEGTWALLWVSPLSAWFAVTPRWEQQLSLPAPEAGSFLVSASFP